MVISILASNYLTDYIEDIYQTLLENIQSPVKLQEALDELTAMTPEPMNTMLEKQPKQVAIQNLLSRRTLVNMSVPPTTPGILFWSIMTKLSYNPYT